LRQSHPNEQAALRRKFEHAAAGLRHSRGPFDEEI
jgi:hypothetical protein